MARLIKLVLYAALAVVLTLGALAAYIATIDPDQFKDDIADAAQTYGGVWLKMDGRLAWSFWPRISLDVSDVQMDWQESTQPLAQFDRLSVNVAALPLLTQQRIEVNGVTLNGARFTLREDASGKVNWMPPASSQQPAPAADTASVDAPAATPSFTLDRLRIEDGQLAYTSNKTGSAITVSDISASLEQLRPNKPFPLQFAMRVQSAGGELMAVSLSAKGQTDGEFNAITLKDLRVTVSQPDATMNFTLSGDAHYDVAADVLELVDGKLSVRGIQMAVSLENAKLQGEPRLRGQLQAAPQDLGLLLAEPADGKRLFSFSTRFDVTSNHLRFTELSMGLNNDKLNGNVQLTLAEPMRATFALQGEQLNLDALQRGANEPSAAPQSAEQSANAALLPADVLRSYDWQGTLTVGRLQFAEQVFEQAKLDTLNKGGRMSVAFDVGNAYGGKSQTRVNVDARSDVPQWDFDLNTAGVDAQTLPLDLIKRLKLNAQLDLRGKLTAHGNSQRALADTMTGSLDVDGGQGTMDLTSIKTAANGVLALAATVGLSDDNGVRWPDILNYQRLTGTLQLNGLDDQDLVFVLDNLHVGANGSYDLVREAIDYQVTLVAKTDAELHSFDMSRYLMDVPWSMRCEGQLTSSGNLCGLDRNGAQNTVAALARNKAGEKIREKIADKLGDKVPDGLRGLFDRLGKKDSDTGN